MAATPARDAKLVQLLNEAFKKERQLEVALGAHEQMTTRDDYAKRLKDHLKETKSHASQVSKRIKQLGGTPETVSVPGPEGLTKADLLKAMEGHIIGQGSLVSIYERVKQ